MKYLSEPSAGKRRSLAEEKFWDELATPELLSDSEPPQSYPAVKLHPVGEEMTHKTTALILLSLQCNI